MVNNLGVLVRIHQGVVLQNGESFFRKKRKHQHHDMPHGGVYSNFIIISNCL